MDYTLIRNRIEAITFRIKEIGGEVQEVTIGEPASHEQITEMEAKLGDRVACRF